MNDSDVTAQRKRCPTGIKGLDEVTRGGLPSGSVYIIGGTPGAGKTILANQICFHTASGGGHCLYITLLSESHDRLIENLQGLEFYSDELVGRIQYQSGFHTLEQEGFKGILRMLVQEAKQYAASLIVLDGLFALQERVGSEQQFRVLMNQLQSLAHVTDCTVLLLTNSERGPSSPEYTMVDGWLELAVRQHAYRLGRFLQVHKLRGSGFLEGKHALTISDAGVQVLPRLESRSAPHEQPEAPTGRIGTGVPELDAMLGGGLPAASETLVVGATGVGKTTLGLHFLSQSSVREPGLLFGFYERTRDIMEKTEALGMGNLKRMLEDGTVEVIWQAPTEQGMDELAYRLIDAVRRRGVKRLLVDSVDALQLSALYPERTHKFLAALTNVLRDEGVTAVFTMETPELIGGETRVSFNTVSAIAQNIILQRYVELSSEMHRTIAVVKARSSAFDARVRKFSITGNGMEISESFGGVDDVLTGHAHPRRPEG